MIGFAKGMAFTLALVLSVVGISRLAGLNLFSSQQILSELGMAVGFYISSRALRGKTGLGGYRLGSLPWLIVGGFGAVLIINAPSRGFFIAGALCIAIGYIGVAGLFLARKAQAAISPTLAGPTTNGAGGSAGQL